MEQVSVTKMGIWSTIVIDTLVVAMFCGLLFIPWEYENIFVLIGGVLLMVVCAVERTYRLFYELFRLKLFNELSIKSYAFPVNVVGGGEANIEIVGSAVFLSEANLFINNSAFGYGEKVKGNDPLSKSATNTYVVNLPGDASPSDKGMLAKNQ